MERVADYILDSEENLKERIGDIMGGKVLELETDKILELGRKQGIEQGIEQGLERGIEQGIEQEKYKTIKNILMNSDFSTREIAMFTGYPEEDILSVHKQMQENMEEDCPIRKTSPQRR
jgi:DNA replication protein DnaD